VHLKDTKVLSREDIYQEFMALFFAGLDTTSHVLLMIFYQLADKPEL
jgi:cytochrome P450